MRRPAYDLYVLDRSTAPGRSRRLGPNINRPGRSKRARPCSRMPAMKSCSFSARQPTGRRQDLPEHRRRAPASSPAARMPASNDRPSITPTDGRSSTTWIAGTLGGPDLYYSSGRSLQPFGPAIHMQELSSTISMPGRSSAPMGRCITFSSARPGNPSPAPDIWYALRRSDADEPEVGRRAASLGGTFGPFFARPMRRGRNSSCPSAR